MKKLLIKLALAALLPVALLGKTTFKTVDDKFPDELLVFKIPKERIKYWETCLATVSQPFGLMILTPKNQDASEILTIEFEGLESRRAFTTEECLEKCHLRLAEEFPESKHIIKTISKSEKDLLIECIVFSKEKKTRQFQAFVYYYLTPKGSHTIAFASKKKLSPQARRQWLHDFQNNCSIQSKKKAKQLASKAISFFYAIYECS